MKTVFTNRELPHRWAHQLQGHGRANSMSFNGECFLSYSTVIARIIKRKGKTAYLLNTTRYSNTTAHHLSRVRQAIPAGATVFTIDECNQGTSLNQKPSAIFDSCVRRAAEWLAKSQRARKNKDWLLARHAETIEEAKRISEFFGLRRKVDDKVVERQAARIEAARMKAAQEQRDREAARIEERKEKIQRWLAGEDVSFPWDVQAIYLRVSRADATKMQTSRGLYVPLHDAKLAYLFALRHKETGWRRNGETHKVGEYQLDSVSEAGIIAGCHHITWIEADRFAKTQGWV